jgi:hypothetical protein
MQPDSSPLSDKSPNVPLLQAMVIAEVEGAMTMSLRGQVFVIRSILPSNPPADVVSGLFDDLDRHLAVMQTTLESAFAHAQEAAWAAPISAATGAGRKAWPPAAVTALILRGLTDYLREHRVPTKAISQNMLCRVITDKGLRGGKGLHPKTLSRQLNANHMLWETVRDELLPQAKRLAAIGAARESRALISRRE